MGGNEFIKLAKETLAFKLRMADIHVSIDDVFIVWFCKTLQNCKCLAGVVGDDKYYELTYNGDKGELYIDTYQKVSNEKQKIYIPSQEE